MGRALACPTRLLPRMCAGFWQLLTQLSVLLMRLSNCSFCALLAAGAWHHKLPGRSHGQGNGAGKPHMGRFGGLAGSPAAEGHQGLLVLRSSE